MGESSQATGTPSSGRVTLDSVAQHALVSRQTVSNVINAPHLVRPATVARVQAAIAELDYRPHLAARQLRTRRSRIIGLHLDSVQDGINGTVHDRFLHALTEEAQQGGYRIMLFTANGDHGEIAQYAELLATTNVDAFVVTGTHPGDSRTAWLTNRNVPFVTFGRPRSATGPAVHPWVDVDCAMGTRAATEHLLAQGHRRIGFLGWPAGSGVGDDRREGWRTAFAAATRLPDSALASLDVETTDGVSEGIEGTRRLLAADRPPTAIVCSSDSLAIGAMSATAGMAGEPVAVVGFDDTPVAAALGLTSVAQPLVEAARECFDLLRRHLDEPAGTAQAPHRLLAPTLVIRRGAPTDQR